MNDLILRKLNSQSLDTNSWKRRKRWIYLIQMTSNGADDPKLPVKIGIAEHVVFRLKGIEGNHPFPLRLVSYFPAIRDTETEQAIHLLFDDFRIRPNAEWFVPDPTIWAFFDEQHSRFQAALTSASTADVNRRRAVAHTKDYERHLAHKHSMDAWERFSQQGMIVTSLRVVDEPLEARQPKPIPPPDRKSRESAIRDMYTEMPIRQWFEKNRIGCINTAGLSRMTGIDEQEIKKMARDVKLPHIRLGKRGYSWRAKDVAASLRILGLNISNIDLLFDPRL